MAKEEIEKSVLDAYFSSMETDLDRLYEDLRGKVLNVSLLGNFRKPLRRLLWLVKIPSAAKRLVTHYWWIPREPFVNGIAMERTSILGPFFHVSALPHHAVFKSEPDIGQQCFFAASVRKPDEFVPSFTIIKNAMNELCDGLTKVLSCLLENTGTCEYMLEFFAQVINRNRPRETLQHNPLSCASSGMFLNLSAVLLRIYKSFFEAGYSESLDPEYIFYSNRFEWRDLTALSASPREISQWFDSSSIGKAKYPQKCELFFLIARVLKLGLIKAFLDLKKLHKDINRCRDDLSSSKAMVEFAPSVELYKDISRLETELEFYSIEKLCHEALIVKNEEILQNALSFYHLMVVWLDGLVDGYEISHDGLYLLPLPKACPMEFASMPEHFIEDTMELLIFSAPIPGLLDRFKLEFKLDKFMSFIVKFMGRPDYIQSPYLRAKMVEVLCHWLPCRSGSEATPKLFEEPLSIAHLLGDLLKFHAEVESMGSQSGDKFPIRYNIGILLDHLWGVPCQRDVWKRMAVEECEGFYLKFLNHLIEDSKHLLGESVKNILELKNLEAELSNTVEWARRQEITEEFHSYENIIKSHMKLVNLNVSILEFSSEEITAPFLRPGIAEVVSSMLNYFLVVLVGPQKELLSLKDPEKYEFRPNLLVKEIVKVYVHLARGDKDNILPGAITMNVDFCHFNEQLFDDASRMLRKMGEDAHMIQDFTEVIRKAKIAVKETMEVERALKSLSLSDLSDPGRFYDPITAIVMRDPVILPTSKKVMDRRVIQRRLLSASVDPFNRAYLTADMLIPAVELRKEIEECIRRGRGGRC